MTHDFVINYDVAKGVRKNGFSHVTDLPWPMTFGFEIVNDSLKRIEDIPRGRG